MTHTMLQGPHSQSGPSQDPHDWDLLFRAVQARLHAAIDQLRGSSPRLSAFDECQDALHALEQLRVMALKDW